MYESRTVNMNSHRTSCRVRVSYYKPLHASRPGKTVPCLPTRVRAPDQSPPGAPVTSPVPVRSRPHAKGLPEPIPKPPASLAPAWDNPGVNLHPPGSRGRRLGGTAVAMPWAIGPVPRRRRHVSLALSTTADASRGTANLLTRPRAGNISSDTRAGVAGRTGDDIARPLANRDDEPAISPPSMGAAEAPALLRPARGSPAGRAGVSLRP